MLASVALLAVAAPAVTHTEMSHACPVGAEDAAAAAVRSHFGEAARVTLSDVACVSSPGVRQSDAAVPEPGSRTEGPVRFVLYADGADGRARVGRLTAVVRVSALHVRTTRALPARTALGADSVAVQDGPIGRVPFGAVVDVDTALDGRLKRSVPAGAVLTRAVVEYPALVRSGRQVVTVARLHSVEVRGRAVAAQDGDLGDIVLVVNPDSRRRLRGRVVGEALVEVLHGS